jgi:hypothetical protein
MRRLAEEQRARVEELARDEGTTCAGCASARLGCGKRRATPRSQLMVYTCGVSRMPTSGRLPILHGSAR